MAERIAVILAAGKGTRMKSSLPKVLHEVGGRSMLDWSLEAARTAGCHRTIVVVGTHSQELVESAKAAVGAENVAIQDPPLGTGHAVLAAADLIGDFDGRLVVLFADTPLLPATVIDTAFDELNSGAALAVLGFSATDPGGYGRLVLDGEGGVERIVEAKDASPEELSITLCNSGVMAGNARDMLSLLKRVTNDNAKGEYYLTDLVALARASGKSSVVVPCAEQEVLGVNSREQLAEAEAVFQAQTRKRFLVAGVTMTDPETVYLAHDTVIEPDVTLEPGVIIGTGVVIRGGARIRAYSYLEECEVGQGACVGPFARLRPGAILAEDVRIGNFVEIKNTRMGQGAKANHLAYLGDGLVGADANIGAGTIFCNYDGFRKHQTDIGDGAFIGSNSALVAPVRIGAGAYVGSGSVITTDVPSDALAVARGRQKDIPGWALRFRTRMNTKNDGAS